MQKIFWLKKYLSEIVFWSKFVLPQNSSSKKCFRPKKFLVRNFFGLINFGSKMFVFQRNFASTKFWVHKNSISKNILVHKIWVQKCKSLKIIGSKKFGQNWVSNSWDIPYIDKCCLHICHCDSWNLFKRVQGTYLSSLVKIGSVT